MKKLAFLVCLLGVIVSAAYAVPLLPGGSAGTTFHAYGGFGGVDNTSTTITISDSAAWYPIRNATDNLWSMEEGTGISVVTDNIVIANKGDYIGMLSLTLTGSNGHDIFVRAFDITDNVVTGRSIGTTVTGAANFQTITLPLYFEIDAQADHTFQFQIRNISSASDVTIRTAVFMLFYLHD